MERSNNQSNHPEILGRQFNKLPTNKCSGKKNYEATAMKNPNRCNPVIFSNTSYFCSAYKFIIIQPVLLIYCPRYSPSYIGIYTWDWLWAEREVHLRPLYEQILNYTIRRVNKHLDRDLLCVLLQCKSLNFMWFWMLPVLLNWNLLEDTWNLS